MARSRVLVLGLVLGAAASQACGGPPPGTEPSAVLQRYADAVEAGRVEEAYALLSDEAKKEMPLEAFRTLVRENPEEIRALVRSLRRPAASSRVTAVVTTPDGESLLMVYESGRWRVDLSAIELYDQSTPRAAIQAFLRALDNGRYDVLLRFVPDEKREGIDARKLKTAFEGEQKVEVEGLRQALRATLPTASIEHIGDRATMSYGAGGSVQLVREHGAWKIEEF